MKIKVLAFRMDQETGLRSIQSRLADFYFSFISSSSATISRWRANGGCGGICLEHYWIAGRCFTTEQAWQRFDQRINARKAKHLQLSHADVLVAQAERITFTEGDYLQRRQDRAHRRYLSAVKMLAVVRKLALLALQINVGQNQVNVAGGTQE